MEKVSMRRLGVFFVSLLIAMLPAVAVAGAPEAAKSTPPPVSQPLVSEGDLAVKLLFTLGAGTTDDVVEAESELGDLGITPRNGWIADYPVTPDIVAEVRNSVASAADNQRNRNPPINWILASWHDTGCCLPLPGPTLSR